MSANSICLLNFLFSVRLMRLSISFSEGINQIKGLKVDVASVETNIVSDLIFSSPRSDTIFHYFCEPATVSWNYFSSVVLDINQWW